MDRDLLPAVPIVDPWLLIAQVEHGPGMHGGVLVMALFAIAVVGGLVYLVAKGRRSNRGATSDRSGDAGDRSREE